jgi:glutamine synthetase
VSRVVAFVSGYPCRAARNLPAMGLDPEQLRALVREGTIDTVVCAFTDLYGRLLGKRLDATYFLDTIHDGTHACDYLFTVDMEMDPVAGYEFANWERGYGDVHLRPDLDTLRVLAWLDRTAFVMCDVHDHHGVPVSVAPRTVLRAQLERARAAGFEVMAASELEYFLFRTSFADAARSGYRSLEAAGWYLEDYHLLQATRTEDLNGAFRRALAASGIPVESTKGEWGRGQHELNIRYAPALEMADRHTLLKQCVKEVADRAGASATFMAKPFGEEAGSSCHVHLSLWSGDMNAFAGDHHVAGVDASDTFRSFLGGWITRLEETMVLCAPTVNSYKRYQSQSWAPTAIAWSPDNRTAAFRVVGSGPSLRIECRVPGADVNPYLVYAAAIASGLDGIERGTPAPAPVIGDVYASTDVPHVPRTLRDATARFAASPFARASFGDDVVEHYAHFFGTEQAAFDRAVTDWERNRYFERI